MKRTPNISNVDMRLLGLLLTPSWLSAVVGLAVAIGTTVGATVLTHYQSSDIRLEFINYQASKADTTTQVVTTNGILTNPLIGNLPLLLFWTMVGLVVYMFAANIFTAIQHTAELRDELEYVNADRHSLLRMAIEHLMVRLAVVFGWVCYILFFFHQVLPYAVAAALVGASQDGLVHNAVYVLLGIVVMAVAMHVHAIFFRLLLLRPRVFSRALYID